MSRAIDEVNHNGVFWKDIDWPPMEECDYCGIPSDDFIMAGHLASCRYLYEHQESPAGRTWLLNKIKDAVKSGWVKKGTMMSDRFDTIRNRDGSFMTEDQIAEHVFDNSDANDRRMVSLTKRDDMIIFHHSVGRYIRNTYGLWDEANPYTVINPEPNSQGIIDHPGHPDQVSQRILERVWDRVQAIQSESAQ